MHANILRPLLAIVVAMMPSAGLAACEVSAIEFIDHARSTGIPYAAPADPGHHSLQLRGLYWQPTRASTSALAVDHQTLHTLASTSTNQVDEIANALLFHGLQPNRDAIQRALSSTSGCAPAQINKATHWQSGVVIAAALPPIFYGGLARALTERGIPVVVVGIGASDANLRLVVNTMVRDHGWDGTRIGLVGHGQSGHAASLLAMQWGGARAIVSLDGFEATAREQHPGLSASPDWRPGLLRAPILLWQPQGRPHASHAHYAAAERSEFLKIAVPDLAASPWATSAQLVGAPTGFATLLPGLSDAEQARIAHVSAQFLAGALTGKLSNVNEAATQLPAHWNVQHRPAISAPQIVTDGKLDEAIWRTARVDVSNSDMSLRIAEDQDYVYIAIETRRSPPFSSELMFDVNGGGGAHWASDDLLLHASNSLCWSVGTAEFPRTNCGSGVAWWGASRTVRAGDQGVAEYFIARHKLGMLVGQERTWRIAARISAPDWNGMLPAAANRDSPSSWAQGGR